MIIKLHDRKLKAIFTLKGPSIKDVRTKLRKIDPPLCPQNVRTGSMPLDRADLVRKLCAMDKRLLTADVFYGRSDDS